MPPEGNTTAATSLLGLPTLLPQSLELRCRHVLSALGPAQLTCQAHLQVSSQRLPSIDCRAAIIASISASHPPTMLIQIDNLQAVHTPYSYLQTQSRITRADAKEQTSLSFDPHTREVPPHASVSPSFNMIALCRQKSDMLQTARRHHVELVGDGCSYPIRDPAGPNPMLCKTLE